MFREYFSRVLVSAAAIAAVVICHAHAQSFSLTPEESQEVGPVIKVGVDSSGWPPLDIVSQQGAHHGLSADYLRLVAEKLGARIEVVVLGDFSEVMTALRERRIDVVPSMSPSRERREFAHFTEPYQIGQVVYVTRRDQPAFDESSLAKWRVVAERGYVTTHTLRKQLPSLPVNEVSDTRHALIAVATNKADVYVGNLLTAAHLMDSLGLGNLEVRHSAPFNVEPVAFAVRKDRPLLASAMSKALLSLEQSDINRIAARWVPLQRTAADDGSRLRLSQDEREFVTQKAIIRVAYNADFSPYSFTSNGRPAGLAIDYVNTLAERANLRIEWVAAENFRDARELVQRGEIDVLAALAATPERRRFLDFIGPIESSPSAIVTRLADGVVDGLEDLSGRTLAQQPGFYLTGHIKSHHPAVRFRDCDSNADCLRAVESGNADATIGPLRVMAELVQQNHVGSLRLVGVVPDGESEWFVGVRRDSLPLRSVFIKSFASLSDAERGAIRSRWLAVNVQQGLTLKRVLEIGLPIALVALAVIGATLYWNRRLAREVERRTRAEHELIGARDRAEAASRAKSAFLAAVGHEIRTPMNGVILTLELLGHSATGSDQKSLVRMAQQASHSLLSLLNDVLDLAKSESGKLTLAPKPHDLARVIEDAARLFEAVAAEKHLAFHLYVDPALAARYTLDAQRLRQVLMNLLSNAVKFTERGSISLTVVRHAAGADSDRVHIDVSDTGIGIAPERIPLLFQPFEQGGADISERFGGTGLGLALCRNLVEQMAGTINATSRLQQGTTIHMEIPFAVVEQRHAPATGQRGRAVLLTIDPDLRETLTAYLEAQSIESVAPVMLPQHADGLAQLIRIQRPNWLLMDSSLLEWEGMVAAAAGPRLIVLGRRDGPAANSLPEDTVVIAVQPLYPSSLSEAIAPANATVEATGARELNTKLRVLVVDDNALNRTVLSRQLAKLGVRHSEVATGEEALALLKADAFDVLLTDLMMPGINGADLAREARKLPNGRHLTVFAITALPEDLIARDLLRQFDTVVRKPVSTAELQALLTSRAARRQDERRTPPGNGASAIVDWTHLTTVFPTEGEQTQALRTVLRETAHALDTLTSQLASTPDEARARAHKLAGGALSAGAIALGTALQGVERSASREDAAAALEAVTRQALALAAEVERRLG